ncbi:urease accessory protein UreD [Microvirga massiliensis]|uniref:urease accessory protein UreD n=1 Tax=Microvirga massiliensis TaxID=1033741 RepID=UPI00062B5DA8|nr:urease accessory protein UreD [Microvirga massiliensis]
MTLPPTRAGGLLDLRFATDHGGVTRLAERHQRFPLHVTAAMYLDPGLPDMAFAYVQNPSGALFGDDRLRISVTLEEGARVHLTTTSATKIHRTASGPARQTTDIRLGPGSFLEYLPDPIIPQGGSAYEQDTIVRVDPNSVAILGEIIAPGRLARDEVFEFDSLFLRTRIELGGEEICTDVLDLKPSHGFPGRRGIFGGHRYVATFYVICPSANAISMADRLDIIARDGAETFSAAAELPDGIGAFVRILAANSSTARHTMNCLWNTARGELLGHSAVAIRK